MELEVRNLAYVRRERSLLQDIAFSIQPGECIAIVGANGSGKTTLLRAVAGLLESSGDVVFGGANVRTMAKGKKAKQLAFITAADETGVDDLRVREVVAHGRFAHRSGFFDGFSGHDEAVDLALEETELSQLAEQRFAQLSSGERRRVWIAMGLAQEASLLLLDEPTAHLDLRHTQRILTVLRHLADQGRTVIMALHDLNDAAQYADRIALIDQGRILAFGTPSEVLTEERIFSSYGVRTEILTANDGTLRVFLCRA